MILFSAVAVLGSLTLSISLNNAIATWQCSFRAGSSNFISRTFVRRRQKCLYHIVSLNLCHLNVIPLYQPIKKRLVFEIQISHNYSDLIVLNCVELMICDKTCLIYGMC